MATHKRADATGSRRFSVMSGTAGGQQLIWSGAGRLNTLIPHAPGLSGVAVKFYDSAIATSGGPFSASGHVVLGSITPNTLDIATRNGLDVIRLNVPFTSGLVAQGASGMPGWTAIFTPDGE